MRGHRSALRLSLLLGGCGSGEKPQLGRDSAGAEQTAALRGRAYQLRSHLPLAGVEVGIAELPGRSVLTDQEGRFELSELPLGEVLTPFAAAQGHALTHHQRFVLAGDVEPLYFQLAPQDLYDLIAAVVTEAGFPVYPAVCQVVTTIGDPSLALAEGWDAFLERGDAGLLPGITAELDPPGGTRLYFTSTSWCCPIPARRPRPPTAAYCG
jgi:hypothetical protein